MKIVIDNSQETLKVGMKVIDMSTQSSAAAYLGKKPEETHTKEEYDRLQYAIRYTKAFKQDESYEKMNEESPIALPLPKLH